MKKLDKDHWRTEYYRQRMTGREWGQILLAYKDRIAYNCRVRQLIAKKLGYGVVEVYKAPLADAQAPGITDTVTNYEPPFEATPKESE